ncbi:MAG: hypothetical protein RBR06_02690 [Desulfuromonadaceae bacterium]|nr:hypothetical protein [Desulfuromonadaceae bacterium]
MKSERQRISRQLDEVEYTLKELRIKYEQYFAGVEKIAPMKIRDELERQLRLLGRRKIIQVDLRYRLQNLSSSYHSYTGMWERVQRQMDEGRYVRHTKRNAFQPATVGAKTVATPPAAADNSAQLYQNYLHMCKECKVTPAISGISSMETFVRDKKEAIRQHYGDVLCSFTVVSEDGKPKIKVKLKS